VTDNSDNDEELETRKDDDITVIEEQDELDLPQPEATVSADFLRAEPQDEEIIPTEPPEPVIEEPLLPPPPVKSAVTRYTRRVKFMRIILPLVALGILGTLFVLPFYSDAPIVRKREPLEHKAPDSTPTPATGTADSINGAPTPIMAADENTALEMSKPRFDGLDSKGRPFTIVAEKVLQQEGSMTADMHLLLPVADIRLNPQESLAVTAENGVYSQQEQAIDLSGNVTLFHDNGYSLTSDNMHVDIQTGHAVTETPTYLRGADGIIDGMGGFELDNFGDHITFKGPAKLILYKTGKEQ